LYRDRVVASRCASPEAGIFLEKVKIIRDTVGMTSQPRPRCGPELTALLTYDDRLVKARSRSLSQCVAEPCTAEQEQSRVLRARFAYGHEQFADVLESLQVTRGHRLLPLRLADGEQHVTVALDAAEDGNVDFCGLAGFRVGDCSAGDAGGVRAAVGLRPGVPAGPLAADLLEVRAGYVAVERALRAPPDLASQTASVLPPDTRTAKSMIALLAR
jgi:hypothetical protein